MPVRNDLTNMDQMPDVPMNTVLHFRAYRLDLQNEQLLRDQQVVRLTGKAFAILRHLAQCPNQLVSREELLRSVWLETFVSATTLTSYIKEIRKALDDDARSPQYIETAHCRGYRFLPVVTTAPVPSSQHSVVSREEERQSAGGKEQGANISLSSPAPIPQSLTPNFVGREREMAELCTSLEKAIAGHGQLTLLVGEAGIGKTRTAEELAAHARSRNVRAPG